MNRNAFYKLNKPLKNIDKIEVNILKKLTLCIDMREQGDRKAG